MGFEKLCVEVTAGYIQYTYNVTCKLFVVKHFWFSAYVYCLWDNSPFSQTNSRDFFTMDIIPRLRVCLLDGLPQFGKILSYLIPGPHLCTQN